MSKENKESATMTAAIETGKQLADQVVATIQEASKEPTREPIKSAKSFTLHTASNPLVLFDVEKAKAKAKAWQEICFYLSEATDKFPASFQVRQLQKVTEYETDSQGQVVIDQETGNPVAKTVNQPTGRGTAIPTSQIRRLGEYLIALADHMKY